MPRAATTAYPLKERNLDAERAARLVGVDVDTFRRAAKVSNVLRSGFVEIGPKTHRWLRTKVAEFLATDNRDPEFWRRAARSHGRREAAA